MTSSGRIRLFSLGALTLTLFSACVDDSGDDSSGAAGAAVNAGAGHGGDSGSGGAGDDAFGVAECKVLGKLCHEADDAMGEAHECHEIGHQGEVEACHESFAACINTCKTDEGSGGQGVGGTGSEEASPYCAALGELCHIVGEEEGPVHDCHELGHIGNGPDCEAGFSECATLCVAAINDADASGVGGAGSGGTGSAGASGVAGGAAGATSE
jgi:hypothetical protein